MSVTMVDVMFARGHSNEFPTVAEVERERWVSCYECGDEFNDWLVVAQNPRALLYFDDAAEAIAETNYEVIAEYLPEVYTFDDLADGEEFDHIHAYETARGYVLVRPTAPELDDLRDLLDQLRDYPLLNEDAYCERETAAWNEYAPMAFRDEVYDALRSGRLNEEQAERLSDRADDLVPIVSQYLHYYNGFSGEYGPAMLDILDSMTDAPEVVAVLG